MSAKRGLHVRSLGISLFIVPKFLVNEDGSLGERNDMHCVSIEHKLGIKAIPTAVGAARADGIRRLEIRVSATRRRVSAIGAAGQRVLVASVAQRARLSADLLPQVPRLYRVFSSLGLGASSQAGRCRGSRARARIKLPDNNRRIVVCGRARAALRCGRIG